MTNNFFGTDFDEAIRKIGEVSKLLLEFERKVKPKLYEYQDGLHRAKKEALLFRDFINKVRYVVAHNKSEIKGKNKSRRKSDIIIQELKDALKKVNYILPEANNV